MCAAGFIFTMWDKQWLSSTFLKFTATRAISVSTNNKIYKWTVNAFPKLFSLGVNRYWQQADLWCLGIMQWEGLNTKSCPCLSAFYLQWRHNELSQRASNAEKVSIWWRHHVPRNSAIIAPQPNAIYLDLITAMPRQYLYNASRDNCMADVVMTLSSLPRDSRYSMIVIKEMKNPYRLFSARL